MATASRAGASLSRLANCAGARVTLILSATKARATLDCKAGKLPTNRDAPRAYSALAFAWRTDQSCAPPEAAACALSRDTRIPMMASPKSVSLSISALRAAKAPASLLEAAFTAAGKVRRGVKIDMKTGSGGEGARLLLVAELAASWTGTGAAVLSAARGATPEPVTVTAIVARAKTSVTPTRRRQVGVFFRSTASTFRDWQSQCRAWPNESL